MKPATINETHDTANSAIDDAVAASETFVDGIRDRLDEAIEDYADTLKTWSATVAEHTKANPLLAVGIAFGAGVVLSNLLRR